MKFYDCHTHLNYEPLSNKADYIADECQKNNILINNVGTNLKSSQEAIDLAKKHKNVFAIVGIHPNDVNQESLEKVVLQMHN
jgi:TatD DNase family protein